MVAHQPSRYVATANQQQLPVPVSVLLARRRRRSIRQVFRDQCAVEVVDLPLLHLHAGYPYNPPHTLPVTVVNIVVPASRAPALRHPVLAIVLPVATGDGGVSG
ncbi:MAG: hypothetical protein ACREAB_11990, partial [Blastocatellia bacterium]